MPSTSIAYVNTARTLAAMSQRRATGELTLATNDHQWKLYFFHGRLLYATGSLHRVRRWHRAMKRHCPDFSAPCISGGEPWEYQVLSQSVSQKQISVSQAQEVIKMSLGEVLFSWVSNPALSAAWATMERFPLRDNLALRLLLSAADVEQVLHQAHHLWKHWKNLELEALNPYQTPVLKQPLRMDSGSTRASLATLSPFLNGRYTLWDIACHARRPITTVTHFVLPWVQRGAIALEEISDLPSPIQPKPSVRSIATSSIPTSSITTNSIPTNSIPTNSSKNRRRRPLIACIDDSPMVGLFLANILEPAGYEVLRIQDPLSGIATLSQQKPDLILLDLVMPNVSGYDLCAFLRKIPIFQNTPIIILTSQSGFIDRTRAKLAGASDFISKPPNPPVMLNLIQTHLQSIMHTATTITCQCWEETKEG